MSAESHAVFLSYASQDAEAVRRIAEALRAAGVEVWFDQNELVGGDAWDAKIRGQIASCALFVPVISAATQGRLEGYFRIEWKLAARRTHAMATAKAFLLPVVIDGTRDAEAHVPDEFREVQWTRLPGGETPAAFCARVVKLLGGDAVGPIADRAAGSEVAAPLDGARGRGRATPLGKPARPWLWPAVAAAVVLGGIVVWRAGLKPPASAPVPVSAVKTIAPLTPARELAERANALSLKKYNSTADDYAAAEGLLKQALALDQNDAEIWAISSQFNTAIRTRGFDDAPARREAARSQAERALTLDEASVEARFALGRWQRDNDPAMAEKTFLAVLGRSPDHPGALSSLGTLYSRQNREEEALAMFERAARNPALLALARYSQYLLHFSRRRFDEAERALRESIAAEPSSNSVTGLAMVLLTAKGDAAAAVRVLAEVPAANRSEHRAVWMTAFVQLAAREPDAALVTLGRLSVDFVQDNWFAGPTAYWVGRAHAQAGRAEAARIAFEAGLAVMDTKLKSAAGDPALHVARGELLARLGRTDEALQAARTATELAGGREEMFWFLSPGRIYAVLGRTAEALPLLENLTAPVARSVPWPLTPALLRLDPLWDKLRDDPRFQALCAEPRAPSVAAPPKADDKSVAVLAFANLSDDKTNEYFSDGISEELLNVLAKVPGLKVTARTSTFHFKGKDTPIPEIAKQLGVAYVVEGSVRKAGDKVRITAQLIKAADGFHVWSDTFTRDLKDVFAVQDEIAGIIAKQLSLKLGASSAAAMAGVSPEALELYVQGRQAWNLRTSAGFSRAEELLNRALVLSPSFARAHAALADVGNTRGQLTGELGVFGRRNSALQQRVFAQIQRALDLDGDCAEAHAALGVAAWNSWEIPKAERALRRAIELNPNYASANQWLGRVLAAQGKVEEALPALKRATELDPFAARIFDNYAMQLAQAGQLAEARAVCARGLEIQPGAAVLSSFQASILRRLGAPAAADAFLRAIQENKEGGSVWWQTWLLALGGWPKEAAVYLPGVKPQIDDVALILAHLGRTDDALAALNPETVQSIMLDQWLYQPAVDPMRGDPRFGEFLATLGASEAHARAQAWRAAHPPEKVETKK
jgi:TolB-like protein/Tfp pilus assembly protein PilF